MAKKNKGVTVFNLSLNEEQKIAKQTILDNSITVVKGEAGAGKTLVACQVALDLLLKKAVDRIIITRPLVTVGQEELGFLPGNEKDKLHPYLLPIYSNMYQLYDKIEVDNMVANGDIEICPLAFLRGRTFVNAIVIIDEAQNCTNSQMEGILSRLGKGSKMIICGDMSQCDLRSKRESGLDFLDKLDHLKGFKIVKLELNHRHEIVPQILGVYNRYRD